MTNFLDRIPLNTLRNAMEVYREKMERTMEIIDEDTASLVKVKLDYADDFLDEVEDEQY